MISAMTFPSLAILISDPVWIALIVAIPNILNAISNFSLHRKMNKTDDTIKEVKKEINGKMTELLTVTGEAEKAKGKLEGIAIGKAEK